MKNEFPIIKDVTYLDSAATTQKPNRVINKVSEYYQKYNSNVHRGLYSLSIESDKLFEKSRKLISEYINSDIEEVIFTRNTTESLNIIANLNAKSLIEQASLATMKVESSETTAGNNNKKGFVINCKLKAT